MYSKFWSISSASLATSNQIPSGNNSLGPNFGFYIPVANSFSPAPDDYFVKQVKISGENEGPKNFFANETGAGSTEDYQTNRKSVAGVSKNYQYPLFLNDPDPTIWKTTATPTTSMSINYLEKPYPNIGGQAILDLTISLPGIVDILVDLNSNDVYDEGIDIILSKKFTDSGTFKIIWDGLDASGNKVPLGAEVNFNASVNFFPLHFPIFDLKQSSGINITNVRPGTESDNLISWDDSEILNTDLAGSQNATNPKVNVTGIQGSAHIWGLGKGMTMNTWAASYSKVIQEKGNFDFLIINGDVFNDYNGLEDDRVNGSPSTALPIYATLINNTTNTVTNVASVKANGTYSLPKVGNGSYRILLRTDSTAQGSPNPGLLLPEGWESTGENLGPGSGNDGVVDGILTGITVSGSSIYRANFGLRPTTSDVQVSNSVDNSKPEFGTNVTFIVSASNNGPSTAKGVQVQEILPNGYTYLNHNTTAGTYNHSTKIWDIGAIPTGTIYTFAIIARVEENGADYLNKVSIKSTSPDTDLENNSAEIGTSPFNASLIAPVLLKGQPIGEQVLLEWEITEGRNPSHFDIERSGNGEAWEGLSRIPVNQYSVSLPHYELTDPRPILGINYYRLRLITLDQRESISKVIKVNVEPTWTISTYPNPFTSQINIKAEDAENMNIDIFDGNGKKITATILESGPDYLKLDFSDKANGIYLIQLSDNRKILSKKIIKVK